MTPQEVSIRAVQTFNSVIQQIEPNQWEMKMPKDFQSNNDAAPTLKSVVDYHAYDDAWIPDMLAGKTMDQAGQEKFKGDILGTNRLVMFAEIAGIAVEAIESVNDLEQIVHCSFGDFSTHAYLQQVIFFRAIRAYDLAKAIGGTHGLTDEFVAAVYKELLPQAEDWRRIGVFGPEVKVSDDAPQLEKLLGLTGRTL